MKENVSQSGFYWHCGCRAPGVWALISINTPQQMKGRLVKRLNSLEREQCVADQETRIKWIKQTILLPVLQMSISTKRPWLFLCTFSSCCLILLCVWHRRVHKPLVFSDSPASVFLTAVGLSRTPECCFSSCDASRRHLQARWWMIHTNLNSNTARLRKRPVVNTRNVWFKRGSLRFTVQEFLA